MTVKRFSRLYFGLFFSCICCLVTPLSTAEQPLRQTQVTSVKEKQVDVITLAPHPNALGAEEMRITVDVRKAARNLHNEEIYYKASRVLCMVDNAYLSSGTVNLLKTALNENPLLDNNSITMRQRAIGLLGLSRNPEAIAVLSNHLQNDPSRRVRWSAAVCLGRLAGEAAIPALKVVLAEDNISTAVITGFGEAGGKAVPILIEMLKDDLKKGGHDADCFVLSLETTCDRRAIKPLLDIISRPTAPSERHMNQTQLKAAAVLAHFATDWIYMGKLKSRAKFAAVHPVPPRESRKVNAADRVRILEALKNAGYDINRLAERFWGIAH